MKSERERVTFTVVSLDEGVPLVHRVRAALKTLLRRHRLKCVALQMPPLRPTGGEAAPREKTTK